MVNESLTFDIETIPQQDPLSEVQQEELDKRLSTYLNRNPDANEEEAKSLLMGTSPYFGEIVTIGLLKHVGYESESRALIGTEREILEQFWSLVGRHRGVFVSYNGLTFDVPFIVKRSMKYNIVPTNNNFLNTRRFQRFPHFDVKEVIADWDRFAAPTLRLACELLGVPSPKEGEVKAEDVARVFKEPGGIQKIADYCVRDLVATYKVYEKVKQYSV